MLSRSLSALVLAFLLASGAWAQPYRYQVIDLGLAPGGCCGYPNQPFSLNDLQQAVGSSDYSTRLGIGFLASPSSFQALTGLYQANDLNNAGLVVGSTPFSFYARASVYQGGSYSFLANPGGAGGASVANGVNNSGQIVGSWQSDAVLWNSASPTVLGRLSGAAGAEAYDINDAGRIIGINSFASGAVSAVMWQGGSVSSLGTLAGVGSFGSYIPTDISESGLIVGWANAPGSGLSRGWIWSDGVMTDIGQWRPQGVNSLGQVVGNGALLWESGAFYNLNTLIDPRQGWLLGNAVDISNAGEILVSARIGDGPLHAALLVPTAAPIPLPPIWAMLLGGLALLGPVARRKHAGA